VKGPTEATEASVEGPFFWPGALFDVCSGDGDGKYDVQLSETPPMRPREVTREVSRFG
jgi:hypothetical protein